MNTNIEFVNYLYSLLNKKTVYMWGEYGKGVTLDRIKLRSKMYKKYYSDDRVNYLKSLVGKGYYGFDCSGMIKSFWMGNMGTSGVKYIRLYDRNSKSITINNASLIGEIDTIPEVKGLLLYMDGHCGCYVGDGLVIECTNNPKFTTRGGVVMTKLSDRKWVWWCKSKWLNYIE